MTEGSIESGSILGETLASYNRRPRTFRPGRRCKVDSCQTLLSIYNSGDYCGTHDGFRFGARSMAVERDGDGDWTVLQAG